MGEKAIDIDSAGRRLFGVLHSPAGDVQGCLVLCHPIFEEKKQAHRILVEFARSAVDTGLVVLRFDLSGCGDSEGEFRDATYARWLADVGAAIDFAKSAAGVAEVGLMGLRIGGTLAADAAAARTDVSSLILWQPVLSGKDYLHLDLRKKQIREMLTDGESSATGDAIQAGFAAGEDYDASGYQLSAALYDGLSVIDLLGKTQSGMDRRVLIVEVCAGKSPSAGMTRFATAAGDAGSEATLEVVNLPPFWSRIGITDCGALLERTMRWLAIEGTKGIS